MSSTSIDLTDPGLYETAIPYEAFSWLRHHDPVSWHPEEPPNRGFWAVTRHRDVEAVFVDPRTYSSAQGVLLEEMQPDEIEARRSVLETDPPDHTRLRKIVSPLFSPRAMREYEGRSRELAVEVVERALERREFDFVADVAAQLPIRILAAILGVPAEDTDQLVHWADQMIGHFDPELADAVVGRDDMDPYRLLPFRSPAALEMIEYGREMAEARRHDPRNDLVTRLVQTQASGQHLTQAEFDNFFVLLVVAGNETSRNAISLGMLGLLEHPGELRRLQDQPELLPSAVEEMLRWATPAMYFRRTATTDTDLAGRHIRAGDKVVMWLISADYDEEVFHEPRRFDAGRTPNPHVAFGRGGPHFCIGAPLARFEIRVLYEELLARMSGFELVGPASRLRSNLVNGVKRMPMRAAPRSGATSQCVDG